MHRDKRFWRGNKQGAAFISTIALTTLTLLGIYAVNRRIRATWTTTEAEIFEEQDLVARAGTPSDRDEVLRAIGLARALTALETGTPSEDPYECLMSVEGDDWKVNYESLPASDTWSVKIKKGGGSLPACPAAF